MNPDVLVPIIVVAGFIALVGGVIFLGKWLDRRRTEAMQQFARDKGLHFTGSNQDLWTLLSTFKLFGKGRNQELRNAMTGSRDLGQVHLADYRYLTGSGKHKQMHHFTIAALRTSGRAAPAFFCRKQLRFLDALGAMLGGQDINFDDDPEFSKRYVLQTSDDEQRVRHFFSPRLRESLVALAGKNPQVEVQDDVLLLHFGRQLKPRELEGLLTDVINLRRNWS